eukprot:TRINITY_DN70253_c0_g1_i1.p1 TRINITY_DN70253_c0_g1~~TRINITY_DN70253_c0_g1_i1.p1  ORF type:complete len:611 (+),score=166.22 TRINITY_DN70253_c0_g1_i1:143-1834(+)
MAAQQISQLRDVTGCGDVDVLTFLLTATQHNVAQAVEMWLDNGENADDIRRLFGISQHAADDYSVVPGCGPAPGLHVGAMVRVKPSIREPKHHWGSVKPGDVGRVTRVDGTKCWVDFERQSNWVGCVAEMDVVGRASAAAEAAPQRAEHAIEALLQQRTGFAAQLAQLRSSTMGTMGTSMLQSALRPPAAAGRAASPGAVPAPCKYFYDMGTCRNGDDCQYLHGERDPRFSAQLAQQAARREQQLQRRARAQQGQGAAAAAFGGLPRCLCSAVQAPPVGTRVRADNGEQGVVVGTVGNRVDVMCFNARRRVPYAWPSTTLTVCDSGHLLLGSRVKRNPSCWRWGDQDGGDGRLGTVTELKDNLWVKVQWDVGKANSYRWGAEQAFDLEVVHDGAVAPGRRVKRSPYFWKWEQQDGNGEGELTEHVPGSGWVTVRWNHGTTNKYRWDTVKGEFDIELLGEPIGGARKSGSKRRAAGGGGPVVPAAPAAAAPRHADPCQPVLHAAAAESDECTICFEIMERPFFTPCFHRFHKTCLVEWSGKKLECPTCCTEFTEEFVAEHKLKP